MPYREVLVHGVLPFEEFPIQSICCNIQGLNSPKLLYIHPNPINIHTLYPYDHIHLLHVSQDNSGQQQTQTETNRHQMTPTDGPRPRVSECCLWTCLRFGFLPGSIWVFRPCLVQLLLYIGKSSKGKIPCTWHFWNIKIPKPPYISSLKIIGLLHFWKFLGPSEENYNLQSIWITL